LNQSPNLTASLFSVATPTNFGANFDANFDAKTKAVVDANFDAKTRAVAALVDLGDEQEAEIKLLGIYRHNLAHENSCCTGRPR